MNPHMTPAEISRFLERVLLRVQKPARYTGGEWNSVVKDWEATPPPLRVALCFPDIYDLGMSNLGLAILYDLVNKRPGMLAERVYQPWVDMEAEMRAAGVPLFSLETRHPLADFDLIGFSLPYEQLYTNVLNMLNLAGLPLRAAQRDAAAPVVIAGGSGCYNPEPMSPFFDAMVIGEGEEVIFEVIEAVAEWRRVTGDRFSVTGDRLSVIGDRFSVIGHRSSNGHQLSPFTDRRLPATVAAHPRYPLWRRLAQIRGVYVPHLYEVSYHPDGTIARIEPIDDAAPPRVVKRIVPVLPPPVTDFIVPFVDVVHNRAAIEIQRGCTRGCRFCQAGMIFRPVRERPVEEVLDAVDKIIASTGFEEIGLLSLSSSDYSHVGELVSAIVERYGGEKLSIGLPSLRIESFSVELMEKLAQGRRRSGFTFAPEAATDRLRDVINKPIATEDLLRVADEVFSRGWTTIKLYFMIGHPTQTLEDVDAIADLAHQVLRIGKRHLGNKAKVRVGVSTLVPKPHTPFQWVPVADEETLNAQIRRLQQRIRGHGFEFSWNDPRDTLVEAFLSRGDRRLADVIERAWQLGAKMDGWQEIASFDAWMRAFAELGLDPDWYARRERRIDEVLPWEHISAGVSKEFLTAEYLNSLKGAVVDDCREHCYSCGILGLFKHYRRQVPDDAWGCPALGRGKARQPVDPQPVPLYVNPEMAPELAAQYGPRVPQRARLHAQA
ncbi:MAG: TIGR03960 family B12-binding radical SAM protein [Anaerolineae bacterium]|nr:TIGR03960 family B12-binding radical SAM protein [Anaerolineae bacterium]